MPTNHFDGVCYWLEGKVYSSYGAKWYLLECGHSLNDAITVLQSLQKEYMDNLRKKA